MTSLTGAYLVCQITLTIINAAGQLDSEKVVAQCLVVDDQFMKVGTPEHSYSPIIMDCTNDKNVKLLNPVTPAIYTFYKEEKDCDYE